MELLYKKSDRKRTDSSRLFGNKISEFVVDKIIDIQVKDYPVVNGKHEILVRFRNEDFNELLAKNLTNLDLKFLCVHRVFDYLDQNNKLYYIRSIDLTKLSNCGMKIFIRNDGVLCIYEGVIFLVGKDNEPKQSTFEVEKYIRNFSKTGETIPAVELITDAEWITDFTDNNDQNYYESDFFVYSRNVHISACCGDERIIKAITKMQSSRVKDFSGKNKTDRFDMTLQFDQTDIRSAFNDRKILPKIFAMTYTTPTKPADNSTPISKSYVRLVRIYDWTIIPERDHLISSNNTCSISEGFELDSRFLNKTNDDLLLDEYIVYIKNLPSHPLYDFVKDRSTVTIASRTDRVMDELIDASKEGVDFYASAILVRKIDRTDTLDTDDVLRAYIGCTDIFVTDDNDILKSYGEYAINRGKTVYYLYPFMKLIKFNDVPDLIKNLPAILLMQNVCTYPLDGFTDLMEEINKSVSDQSLENSEIQNRHDIASLHNVMTVNKNTKVNSTGIKH